MAGKMLYGALLSLLLAYSAWQWVDFELPVMKHAVLPPALPTTLPLPTGQLESILEHNLWDKARGKIKQYGKAALDADKLKDARWVLKGIGYQQMHMPVAVIAVGTAVKMYHEGDVLPDGAVLTRMTAGSIVIERNGEKQNVYLFKK